MIGRLPLVSFLNPLDKSALRRILTEPRNALIKQYVRLFEMEEIALSFEKDVLDYIVDKAMDYKLGARGLRSICEAIMMDAALEHTAGRKAEAAELLGWGRNTLTRKLSQKS